MKKKLIALILCMVIALGLTACRMSSDGKRDADNSDVTQSQTQSYEAKDITVAALKGPTAIGMVKLMEDSKEKKTANNYDFKIAASADEFSSLLIKGDVQIAALPCNAAATLYNKSNGKIKVLGINTLGVLYIVEKGNTVQNVADLKGKTIYTTGKGTTPEYTLKYLLKKAGLDAEKDVNIEFKSEASEAAAMLASSDSGAVAMLPQPYVTTVMAANSDVRIALDVTKEWENLSTDGSTVVTGVIAVNVATFIGYKIAGIIGGIIATLGVITPSVIIITLIAAFLTKFADLPIVIHAFNGVRVCVCVLILNAIIKLGKKSIVDKLTFAIFIAVSILSIVTSLSPIIYIIISGVIGALIYKFRGGKEEC